MRKLELRDAEGFLYQILRFFVFSIIIVENTSCWFTVGMFLMRRPGDEISPPPPLFRVSVFQFSPLFHDAVPLLTV